MPIKYQKYSRGDLIYTKGRHSLSVNSVPFCVRDLRRWYLQKLWKRITLRHDMCDKHDNTVLAALSQCVMVTQL